MKWLYLSITLHVLFFISSCQNSFEAPLTIEERVISETVNSEQKSYYVSFEDALGKAEKIIGENNRNFNSLPIRNRKVKEHFEYIVPKLKTRSNIESEEIRFHVINFENNAGFALVSADSRTTDVYAYGESGNLNIKEATENTGFSIFMNSAAEYYEREIANYKLTSITPTLPPTTDPIYGDIPYLATEEIDGILCHVRYTDYILKDSEDPLVSVEWNQCSPYNYYCPSISNAMNGYDGKAAAGCGPVALAQIMSYHQHPTSTSSYIFDWNSIMQSTSYPLYLYTTASLATANLIRAVGDYSKADYGVSTPTTTSNLENALFSMEYTHSSFSGFNESDIHNSIDSKYPVLIVGSDALTGDAHAWVIDGYRYEKQTVTYYHTYIPYDVYRENINYRTYFHCNWGWGAYGYNGFCLNTFQVKDSSENHEYRNDLKVIYDIKPNN